MRGHGHDRSQKYTRYTLENLLLCESNRSSLGGAAFVPDDAIRKLLEHFCATSVRRTPIHGKYVRSGVVRMRTCMCVALGELLFANLISFWLWSWQMGMVFADFAGRQQAAAAVEQLYGMKLGSCCVIAELLSPDEAIHSFKRAQEVAAEDIEPVAPLLGLNHEADTSLEYVYPPATPETVHNIAQAILAVPRLYTQVCWPASLSRLASIACD